MSAVPPRRRCRKSRIIDMKLEDMMLPVSNRSGTTLFQSPGWRMDADIAVSDNFRASARSREGDHHELIFG
jgi:hypothetical protein